MSDWCDTLNCVLHTYNIIMDQRYYILYICLIIFCVVVSIQFMRANEYVKYTRKKKKFKSIILFSKNSSVTINNNILVLSIWAGYKLWCIMYASMLCNISKLVKQLMKNMSVSLQSLIFIMCILNRNVVKNLNVKNTKFQVQ